MSLLSVLKRGLLLATLFVVLVGGLWVAQLKKTATLLNSENISLTQQNQLYLQRLQGYGQQMKTLDEALTTNAITRRQAEEKYHAIEQKMRVLLANDRCAREPVPAAVIRLQQRALGQSLPGAANSTESAVITP
ncbi:DUF2570 domain-containing protein [Yersinia nurmii]|uniref:DUF2570 domain-containing protein n=1 Tax=Yersinia nurmii TaxID=685706 RepID=A0AAW7K684_9GAMM|nr:DUF2570 domain-containing protein [Yersinia nurmii]MDN0089342.1 DUF2570 domain-containing protein [Yersinia nurmii]CNE18021.1 Preprotein translocase subunit SecA [Yersinia nurmii]